VGEREPGPSTEKLLAMAVAEATSDGEDDDAYWERVWLLQKRDPGETWSLLVPLTEHVDPRVRALVPDVLRYLGGIHRPLTDQTVALFDRMLRHDAAPQVLESIGHALGDIGVPAAVEMMIPYASHPEPDVRFAVVSALLRHRDPRAIQTLIELSRDEIGRVRDWATFGLGSQVGGVDPDTQGEDVVDTPAVRDALADRLSDPDEDARCEAIVGLAMRRDPRVLPVLVQELEKGPKLSLILEAARWAASSTLCPSLRKLASSTDSEALAFWNQSGLQKALDACCTPSGLSPQRQT
jgi:HEAT repeat protein